KWARKDKLCVKCAAKAHAGGNCPVAKESGKENGNTRNAAMNKLHAIISGIEDQADTRSSELDEDSAYLCSVQDKSRKDLILMMYDCEVNKHKGTALGDIGATLTYISG